MVPPLMSAVALFWPCGPPEFTARGSWKEQAWAPARGSGTQLAGLPLVMVNPSTPGKVPKYESKLRFSCMITITCWILWMPAAGAGVGVGREFGVAPGTRGPAPRAVGRGEGQARV